MSELDALGIIHGTDKCSSVSFAWDYLRHYQKFFARWRDERINLLEIGAFGGSSLRMWKSYFTDAQIVGIDIDPACEKLAEERVAIRIGSQEDPAFLQAVAAEFPPTIVIDDGSHRAHHMIASFETLFPALAPGGLYVLEDLAFHFEDGVRPMFGAKAHQGLSDISIYDYLLKFGRSRAANNPAPSGAWGFAKYAHENIDSLVLFGGCAIVTKREPRDVGAAIATFEREIGRNPTDETIERFGSYLTEKVHDYDRAIALLTQLVTAQPGRPSALNPLFEAYLASGRIEAAAGVADRLTEIEPNQPNWWRLKVRAERAFGRADQEIAGLNALKRLGAGSTAHDRRLAELTAAAKQHPQVSPP